MRLRPIASPFALALVTAFACNRTNPDDFPVPTPPEECATLNAPEDYVAAPKSCSTYKSCVFSPTCTCTEPATPYQCPAMRPWAAVAHAPSCGTFDGTQPSPTTGKCVATAPKDDAVAYAGKDPKIPGRYHLGDGHFVEPAGHDQILHGSGVVSAFLADVTLVPGTRFAVAVDGGVRDNAVYSIDLDKLALDQPSIVSTVEFARPKQVDRGIEFVAPDRVYVSGAADGAVYGFKIDAAGKLTRDATLDVAMGKATAPVASQSAWYVGGLAGTADAKKLVVAPSVGETQVRVIDLATKQFTAIDLGAGKELFGVFADPFDPSGNTMWVSSYDPRQIVRVDLATGQKTGAVPVGKNPEGIAFLDASTLVVANSDDDTLLVVDGPSQTVKQTLKIRDDGLTGAQPSVMAYDGTRKRLYVAMSGVNAIGAWDVDTSKPAVLVPRGQIPTGWWPTGLRLRPDGSLVVVSAKGHGIGPVDGNTTTPDATEGSIQLIAAPADGDFPALTATVTASRSKTATEGYPTVDCSGASYDFPIPLTNTGAPSTQIEHVVYVVRENKTFDSIFGDFPAPVNGDPKGVMSPGRMDEFWANARTIAKAFTNFDNYYIPAEQSLQGHVWTSHGRSTDYIERTWSSSWGRGVRAPKAGIDRVFGSPGEGSLFLWAERNKVPYDDMGEIVGGGDQGFDSNYPGLVFSQTTPDTEKACYIAARARAVCDLKALTYVVLPNDHTKGDEPGAPTPELMIAVNDVGTGMILDALSHSPIWAKTLLIVTEDDPQEGADHVSGHRTPLFMASPWIKRGYVSHTNLSTASIHKLIANIFAKPYASESIASAAIPFDAFTSTPDYGAYSYKALQTKVSCNPAKGWSSGPGTGWDFSMPDNQPGLDEAVVRHMRAIAKP